MRFSESPKYLIALLPLAIVLVAVSSEALGFGEGAERKATQMDRAFPDACIEGWERRVGQVVLPDPDDRHVVAVAIEGDCDCIVTYNRRDFPEACLKVGCNRL